MVHKNKENKQMKNSTYNTMTFCIFFHDPIKYNFTWNKMIWKTNLTMSVVLNSFGIKDAVNPDIALIKNIGITDHFLRSWNKYHRCLTYSFRRSGSLFKKNMVGVRLFKNIYELIKFHHICKTKCFHEWEGVSIFGHTY